MLTVTRKDQEGIQIGDEIFVYVTRINPDKVRLSIEAPRHIKITRTELHRKGEGDGEPRSEC